MADVTSDLRRRTISMLEAMGIPVEYSFHEDSPSQHEIDLRYTNALEMADNVMTFRLLVREIALERGVLRHVHAQAARRRAGLGHAHPHEPVPRRRRTSSTTPRPAGCRTVARQFIAGLLRHAREITAVTNQLVNSYKRLIVGSEAPPYVTWAHNNRSALIRVPVTKRNKPSSTRIEYRAPDPACNPYLAFSVILAAGLRGIEEGYELPPEAVSNLYELTPTECAKLGVVPLPGSLAEALDEMERSELVLDALGDHIFEWFLRNKRVEWNDYRAQVTPFELASYLPSW